MTVNLHVVLRIHPAAYRYKLEVIPTVPRLAVIRSDDVCLFVYLCAGIRSGERQLISRV
jgi:hypothetical protein